LTALEVQITASQGSTGATSTSPNCSIARSEEIVCVRPTALHAPRRHRRAAAGLGDAWRIKKERSAAASPSRLPWGTQALGRGPRALPASCAAMSARKVLEFGLILRISDEALGLGVARETSEEAGARALRPISFATLVLKASR